MPAAQILYNTVFDALKTVYPNQEAAAISYRLLEELFFIDKTAIIIGKIIDWDNAQAYQLQSAINRLLQHEPLQHIVGRTHFYGRTFLVNKNVLIPRPETEELVHLIVDKHKSEKGLKILDIGTGSGILPITLFKELQEARLFALDVSEAALATAKRNAELNRAEVHFIHLDILKEQVSDDPYDIWVSNPPYVLEKEKVGMQANVLDYEPAQALFVPDHDPLLFYRRIAHLAIEQLKAGGHLYFEINEAFGHATIALLQQLGFENINCYKDMNGKDRMVSAKKPILL